MIRRKVMSDTNPLKRYIPVVKRSNQTPDSMSSYPFFSIIARNLVEKSHPEKVLDVGCDQGTLVYAFRELGVESYGVDFFEHSRSCSHQSVKPYLSLADVDFEPLPFDEESFNLVTCCQVLQHLQRPGYLISEIWRVLKPDGIAYITIPTLPFESSIWRSFGIVRDEEHINDHARQTWIRAFEINLLINIKREDMQEIIAEAFSHNLYSSSFWLSQRLRRLGPLGKKIEKWLTRYTYRTYVFRKQQFHPEVLKLIASRDG